MTTKIDQLEIIYRDEHYIAVNKPPGIHVHPTSLSKGEDSCMRILRDQIGQRVYTIHRLDRATSGVLLFALSSKAAGATIALFQAREIQKRYLAVVRGYPGKKGVIERPQKEEKDRPFAEAITEFQRLAKVELPVPVGKFPTARYSLMEIIPKTGRRNQIRKHFASISHPIVGDVPFGDGRQNRLFREQFGIHRLLLMATTLAFQHPFSRQNLTLIASIPANVQSLFEKLGWKQRVD